jgi:hypothetical protein
VKKIAGNKTFLVVMFGRLPCQDGIIAPQEKERMTESTDATIQGYLMTVDSWNSSSMFDHLDDFKIFDCFLDLPVL